MKKFLAFLLSFAMICSMMTVVVFADSESNEAVEENESVMALELVELEEEQLATLSYVPFSSGVYRFDSLYNTGMCMTVEDGEYTSGALVVQWNTSSNSQDTLFKVEYAGTGIIPATNGNADYYVIRSMVNSEIGLTAATPASGSNAVTLQTLSTNNSNQYWNQYWVHMEDSGCDVWMNAATGTCLGSPEGNANNSALEMSSGGANAWWQLVEYTGPVIEGVVFTSGATSTYGGGTYYYDAYMYSSEIGVNGPVVYGVRNGSGEANIVSSSGKLTPNAEGTVTVYATASGMTTEATRTVSITGYSSAEYAAEAFAIDYSAESRYILSMYGALIYKITNSGVTTYYYSNHIIGTACGVSGNLYCPSNATVVARIFTYVLFNDPTERDRVNVAQSGIDHYFSFVNVNKLERVSGTTGLTTGEWDFSPDPLTSDEMGDLDELYEDEWKAHVESCPTCSDAGIYNPNWPEE